MLCDAASTTYMRKQVAGESSQAAGVGIVQLLLQGLALGLRLCRQLVGLPQQLLLLLDSILHKQLQLHQAACLLSKH